MNQYQHLDDIKANYIHCKHTLFSTVSACPSHIWQNHFTHNWKQNTKIWKGEKWTLKQISIWIILWHTVYLRGKNVDWEFIIHFPMYTSKVSKVFTTNLWKMFHRRAVVHGYFFKRLNGNCNQLEGKKSINSPYTWNDIYQLYIHAIFF